MFMVTKSLQQALEAEGLVIVPKEPTERMLNDARDWSRKKYGKPIGNDAARGCWAAMAQNSADNTEKA